MIIYEVNLELDSTIYDAFLNWLPMHIAEILSLNGFKNAYILHESNNESYPKIIVQYILENHDDLQNYFDHHATSMRNKTVELFGDKFKATRRILELIKSC